MGYNLSINKSGKLISKYARILKKKFRNNSIPLFRLIYMKNIYQLPKSFVRQEIELVFEIYNSKKVERYLKSFFFFQ